MTTLLRHPLTTRRPDQPTCIDKIPSSLASQTLLAATNKRPRSPGIDETNHTAKKAKPASLTATQPTTTLNATNAARDIKERKEKMRQKEERQQAKEEFVMKYTKAFPSFVFYFDERDGGRQQAESSVLSLGARIEHFFSASVTHVITNCPQPPKNEQYDPSNKENVASKTTGFKGSILRSPIQLKARGHDHGGYDKLVRDAVQLDKKIWSFAKLDNILSRLLPSCSNASKAKTGLQSAPLTQLLEHERLHGTTSERDPRERRHDYEYFTKGSHFLLVEDICGELAPIAIMEYPAPSRIEKDKLPVYPVLHMDPRARSPFIKFDEKEERKLEKIEANERLHAVEKERHCAQVKALLQSQREEMQKRTKTLRRRASMGGIDLKDLAPDRSASGANSLGFTGETGDQQIASGFAPSTVGGGYLAASGNSVAITSTTTTSLVHTIGGTRLPPNLRERLGRQVVTSRIAGGKENVHPNANPNMLEARLRKAKSTTTMRLPAREESKKPGYCEACRVKFADFKEHVRGSRHRKFAENENNYIDLDFLLRRLQRKPKAGAPSDTGSANDEDEPEDATPSDACLGPGDYFYLSPQQELHADLGEEASEGSRDVPQIIVDEYHS